MLILRIWNYLRGYVIISVEGYFLERFINICINKNIYLWDIKRQKSCLMTLKISAEGFKRIRPIVRKTKCRIQIKHKKGLPFFINKYRKRKSFFIGIIICCVMLYILSSFIWTIDVYGNKTIPKDQIINDLSDYGLKVGIFKPRIYPDYLCNEMMIKRSDLAWIGVEITGTKAVVEIVEKAKAPQMIEKDIPCNIIAAKDGVIKRMIVENGKAVVKEKDTVKKGQLLVSGVIDSMLAGKTRYVHSIANVTSRTWYDKKYKVLKNYKYTQRTGNKKNMYSLGVFLQKIKIGSHKNIYNLYDLENTKNMLSLGKNYELPFEFIIDTYYEKKEYTKILSSEEARQKAHTLALNEILSQIPKDAKIVDNKASFLESQNAVTVDVVVECEEDIAYKEKILK